jgi:hypothetical protein
VKLKLVICARPEFRAGFLICSAIEEKSCAAVTVRAPFPSLRRLHGSAGFHDRNH